MYGNEANRETQSAALKKAYLPVLPPKNGKKKSTDKAAKKSAMKPAKSKR